MDNLSSIQYINYFYNNNISTMFTYIKWHKFIFDVKIQQQKIYIRYKN